ncbi:MAG: EF-hand domain-containing protein, partial [Thermohalobaculum sp.]|nr:EF-hand domain-containing protein [Thermohalobaculum sp.]
LRRSIIHLALGATIVVAPGAGGAAARQAGAEGKAEHRVERLFKRLDTDGDGAISDTELRASAEARLARRQAKRFARLDANRDGRIEPDEIARRDAARLGRLDTDGNRLVTRDEMQAARDRRARE